MMIRGREAARAWRSRYHCLVSNVVYPVLLTHDVVGFL